MEEALFMLDAHSHYVSSEYSQAFVFAWLLVERHMNRLWTQFLDWKKTNQKRKQKLTNPMTWALDDILEALNLGNILKNEEYSLLMRLKSKRNRFVHQGEPVRKDDAFECLQYACKSVFGSLYDFNKEMSS